MKQASFGDFHVGQVLNPSVEDKGGFEFASGMDIFSEPGVMKASRALVNVTLTGGLTISTTVRCMVEVIDSNGAPRLYCAHGSQIWESVNGTDFSLFLTNSEGTVLSLAGWNGYLLYASDLHIGRVPIGNAASKDDDYINTGVEDNNDYHPMVAQGGTMKVGNGRYVGSLDESFNWTPQAMKTPVGYTVKTMAVFNDRLFIGANEGQASGGLSSSKATVFEWRGILQTSASALPDAIYTLDTQGIHSLVSDGQNLFAFPGSDGAAWVYTGGGFQKFVDIFPDQSRIAPTTQLIEIQPFSVAPFEGSLLYSGRFFNRHGVFQVKGGRVSQPFVPSFVTPGENSSLLRVTPFVHVGFMGHVYVSTQRFNTVPTPSDFYFQRVDVNNRQNNAMCQSVWHRHGTDRFKRWAGIRLNLKPMTTGTAVTVGFRTGRTDSFTAGPHTITSANQNKPVLFPVRPRAKEIQFQLTYTTNGVNTPEMTSYNPIFDALNSTR